MIAFLLLIIFVAFAVLMLLRKMPALLALPSMAVLMALVAGLPIADVLNNVVASGAVKLAPVYVAVFMGAMMGQVLMQTGIAEQIIKRAAEFGGEKPLWISLGLMLVTAVLFTTLQGLGAIITVGSLVLPIMMSLGVPRKLAGVLFLLAFGTGFIFNPILFTLYKQLLNLDASAALPPQVGNFALMLAAIMVAAVGGYAYYAAKRSADLLLLSAEITEAVPQKKSVSGWAMLTPVVPLVLYFGFQALGFKLDFIAAFLIGSVYGVLTTNWRKSIRVLTASAIKGIEDGAPAAFLLMGIGMLLLALQLPPIKSALEPYIVALPLHSPLFYIAFFTLLSPLSLYRGPLNLFGIGIGLFSLMFGMQIMPPLALLAAIMCVLQVQNVCDPTNTHSVWIANFVGVRVEELMKATLWLMMLVCFVGLLLAAALYY